MSTLLKTHIVRSRLCDDGDLENPGYDLCGLITRLTLLSVEVFLLRFIKIALTISNHIKSYSEEMNCFVRLKTGSVTTWFHLQQVSMNLTHSLNEHLFCFDLISFLATLFVARFPGIHKKHLCLTYPRIYQRNPLLIFLAVWGNERKKNLIRNFQNIGKSKPPLGSFVQPNQWFKVKVFYESGRKDTKNLFLLTKKLFKQ